MPLITSSSEDRATSPTPSGSSTESPIDVLDATAEDQWDDISPDTEDISFRSLFDDTTFQNIDSLLQHDVHQWKFDLRQEILRLGLDFYGCIKLVNYVRSQVLNGNKTISIRSSDQFQDKEYLQPVLEDDAVLFNLDELLPSAVYEQMGEEPLAAVTEGSAAQETSPETNIQNLQEQLKTLQKQFSDYRSAVEQTLDKRWGASGSDLANDTPPVGFGARETEKDQDDGYFDSYAYHEIHETMLKDEVRTSAYRDFIYDNKHIFAGKTVLDIGCGTAILSMFAAKGGAEHVFAVDNSKIIDRARKIVAENRLEDKITCIQGKIEDINLPVDIPSQRHSSESTDIEAGLKQRSIDIIISEWFGYCLLFENMLDSVLQARDRYSSPKQGHVPIMLPSYTTLHIAPFSDPDYIASNITYWHSVYGFSMSAMLEPLTPSKTSDLSFSKSQHISNLQRQHPTTFYEDVIIREVDESTLIAPSTRFKTLNLNTIPRQDLTFASPFTSTLTKDAPEGLDGWIIWFDVFFLTDTNPSTCNLPSDARGEVWPGKGNEDKGVALTTGPPGPLTHWKQACLLIDRGSRTGQRPMPLSEGQKVAGTVWYRKGTVNARELEIEVEWSVEGTEERGRQTWFMRCG